MPEFDGYDIIDALISDGLIQSQKIVEIYNHYTNLSLLV